jgi:glutamyl-tRNA synthetase
MHLGNARTALLAWLQARAARGRIALRIDDLDVERCRPEHAAGVVEDLAWLGLDWDGEVLVQSTRSGRYAAAVADLERRGLVYECFCTRAELRAAASAPHADDDLGPPYAGTCRELTPAERAQRRAAGRAALRLRVPPGLVGYDDALHGTVVADVAAGGDFPLRRTDGVHAYVLATVVDDADTGVTDVLRGDDLLAPTARQVLLQTLLGLPTPRYCHVPLLYGPDGARLAKRHGAVTLRELRGGGVPADAVVGWLAATAGLAARGERLLPPALVERFDVTALAGTAATVDRSTLAELDLARRDVGVDDHR